MEEDYLPPPPLKTEIKSSCIDDLMVPPETSGVVYNMRLTDTKQNLYLFVDWVRDHAQIILCVFEIAKKNGKEHLHLLFIPHLTKSTFFQAFHKYFNKKYSGNKDFKCNTLTKDIKNNLIYFCKGTRFLEPEVMAKDPKISDAMITQYWKHYWSDKPIEDDKTLSTLPLKKTAPTWSENLTILILKEMPAHNWQYCGEDIDILYNYVLQNLGTQSKKLNSHIVRDLVLGQLNSLTNGKCFPMKKKFQQEMFPDLFGNL